MCWCTGKANTLQVLWNRKDYFTRKIVLKRFIFVPQCLIYDIKLETNNIHLMKITYLTYSSGKKSTKHFILPPSLVNAYLLYYLEPASYQTPYSPSQHSATTHKTHTQMQHSIKDKPTYIYPTWTWPWPKYYKTHNNSDPGLYLWFVLYAQSVLLCPTLWPYGW